jgi:cell division protein FtsI (penicillin-binding protein 3)
VLFRSVGPEGTGRLAGLSGVDVAGKTGTAQKLDPETRRYGRDRYIAWFIGIVPAESPKLVITVMLDEPGKIHSGGGVAAPLFARVASSQLAHLGIATRPEPIRASPAPTGVTQVARHIATPTEAPSPVPRKSAVLPAKEPETPPLRSSPKAKLSIVAVGTRLLMPDFRGHSLADVRQVTAAHSLDLETSGSGQAIFQQPAPGTILGAGQRRVRVRFADAPPAKWGDS